VIAALLFLLAVSGYRLSVAALGQPLPQGGATANRQPLTALWHRATRETNSHAAAARGVEQYGKKQYAEAERSFAEAQRIAPTAANAFNLGTAQIAAGRREEGSATLGKAMKDGALRADALYNRGNSALAAKAYDYAIRDYVDALRLRPHDGQTKRNLEIALARRQAMQQAQSGRQQNPQGSNPQKNPAPKTAGEGAKPEEQQTGQAAMDALLRSVQQQEQEEIARMKSARGGRARVGW
jgi:Ca-activated chloride channel family protein